MSGPMGVALPGSKIEDGVLTARERHPLRFTRPGRLEAFNLFNSVQFGLPNTTVTTAATNTLGQVTTQANQPRLMQLVFRLTF